MSLASPLDPRWRRPLRCSRSRSRCSSPAWSCWRPATRSSATSGASSCLAPAPGNHRQHRQPERRVLPLRDRRRDRLPDEPVQHRRRRPVPPRGFRRGRSAGGLVSCPAAAHLSSSSSRWWSARPGPASPACSRSPAASARSSRRSCSTPSRSLIAYLLRKVARRGRQQQHRTKPLPSPAGPRLGWLIGDDSPQKIYGFIVVAVARRRRLLVLLNRTRFGFDLRATGRSPTAAVASGVNVKRMVVISMLLSGAVAGLVGMPVLLGEAYTYASTFPAGLGFTGIAIALLGRNHPVGIAFGALLFAFLDLAVQPAADPRRHLAGDRRDHAGRHRAVRRHRLRAGPRYGIAQEQRRVARASWTRRSPPEAVAEEHGHDQPAVADPVRRPPARDPPAAGIPGAARRSRRLFVSRSSGGHRRRRHHVERDPRGRDPRLAVPIAMAGLGGLWSERAGIVNIGLEGMMILGTWGAATSGYQWGPWAGVAGGIALGALGGLLHAIATVTFGVDHIVSGVAINIIGLGVAQYLAKTPSTASPTAGARRSRRRSRTCRTSRPGRRDWLPDRREQGLVPRLRRRRRSSRGHHISRC
jgi:ABC-type uncharacterized transport system permease subunit